MATPLELALARTRPVRQSWLREVGGAFGAGVANLGLTGTRLIGAVRPDWFDTLFGLEPGAMEKAQAGFFRRGVEHFAPRDVRPFGERFGEDPVRAVARAAAGGAPSLLPVAGGVAVGGLVGGPPGAVAGGKLGATIGGALGGGSMGLDAYDEAISRGAPQEKALAIGTSVGVVGALLERLGARGIAKPAVTGLFGAARQAVRDGSTRQLARQILAGTAAEVTTEEAQELLSVAGEYAAGRPIDEITEDLADRLAEAGAGALVLAGGVGSVSALGQRGQRKRAERLLDPQRMQQAHQQLLEQLEKNGAQDNAALMARADADAVVASSMYGGDLNRDLSEIQVLEIPEDRFQPLYRAAGIAAPGKLSSRTHFKAKHVGSEVRWVDKAKQIFGKKSDVVRGLEIAFSLGRVGNVRAQALLDNPILDFKGQEIAPALKTILGQVIDKTDVDLSQDPDSKWLKQFVHPDQWREAQQEFQESPLLRPLEELRWILRQEELALRAQENPDALVKPNDKMTALAVERHEYLKTLPEYNLLKRTAEELSKWDQHLISLAVSTGILSQEAGRHILSQGPHYAGFFEIVDEEGQRPRVEFTNTHGFDPQKFFQPVLRGLAGGERLVLPTTASIQRAQSLWRIASRQIARQNIVRMIDSDPEVFASEGIYLDVTEPPASAPKPPEGYKDQKVYVDGEERRILAPAPWMDALEAMPKQSRNFVRSLAATFTSMRRATSILTPRFAATTLFRDQPEAANIAATYGVTYRPWVDAIQGFSQLASEFISPGSNPRARQFLASGGGLASIASTELAESLGRLGDVALRVRQDHAASVGEAAKYMLRRAGRAWGGEIRAALREDKTHIGSAILSPLAHLTDVIDKSTRLGLFNASLRSGKTVAEAMDVSRRAAIDFNRKGTSSQFLGDLYPFYNPQVQSWDLNTEAATRGGAHVAAMVAGIVVLPELLHFALTKDDEEYHARPAWEKKRNYFWHKMDSGEWITTPRPLGWLSAVFGYSLGQVLQQSYRDDPRLAGRVLGALQDEIPLVSQFSGIVGLALDAEGQAGFDLEMLPEAAVLPFELGVNRKAFFNTPVVPAWMEYRHPKERAFRSTPEVYRWIAQFLPEKISPLQLEHVGRTGMGSLGAGALRFVDALKKDELALDDIPAVTAFVARRRDAPSLGPVQRLFELVRERKYYRSFKPTPEDKKGQLRKLDYDRLAAALKRVRKLVEARNTFDQHDAFEERNEMDKLILQIATEALQQVGERGEPGSGPLGDFWEKFRKEP